MAPSNDSAGSRGPRSRRSIAYVPRSRLTGGVDKENATTDISALEQNNSRAKPPAKDKKSRSKSLGPGGLDALQNSNGNRRKSTTAFPLKSILKPTVPVSPVRDIPSFEETRRQTPAHGSQLNQHGADNDGNVQEGLLIDFDTPIRQPAGTHTNPFDTFNASSAIRDEKAAREREAQERWEREKQTILEQREARRKSMANRRVSFAPEATLHTWNVVEVQDDSTTSSNSNSTRRTSSLADSENKDVVSPRHSEASSDMDADSDIAFSPVHHDDLQQLRNRPASAGNYIGDLHESSSPFSGSSADGSEDIGMHTVAGEDEDDGSSGSDSGFDGESTAMSMDDMTARSSATAQSEGSDSNGDSSARLNESLRQAAQEAGTRLVDMEEENGDMSMEIADQEITGAFQPWIKKGQRQSFDWGDISAVNDQENVDPSKQSRDYWKESSDNEDEDLSMEVTNAIGGILPSGPTRRQSVARRKSSGAETNYDEQTMELTNVVGGLAQPPSPAKSVGANSEANDDEEMTMEFTSVVGGVIGKSHTPSQHAGGHREHSHPYTQRPRRGTSEWNNGEDDNEDMEMEMTRAVGGILPSTRAQPQDHDDEDQTGGMDVTAAVGRILPPGLEVSDKSHAKKVMEMESDAGQLGSSPFQENVRQSPAKSPVSYHVTAVASENGSPSLASVRSRRRRSASSGRASTTPTTSNPRQSRSPVRHVSSPLKQGTIQTGSPAPPFNPISQVADSSTPKRTPPSTHSSAHNPSPKKLFQPELEQASKKSPRKSLFGLNASTGESTPLFVLRPRERRSSGLGIDKEGLGSPRVAAMLDSRRSIGEEVAQPSPQEQRQQGVRFEDPVKLQQEVDREREEEENREDGHINPPLQSREPTSNLREMISNLSPKKGKTAGRKSLHVGSARGVLGKRPKELDEDDDGESDKSPKRLRSREASPVKNVKLPAPPSINETIGRSTRSPTHKPSHSPARRSRSASPRKESTTPTRGSSGTAVTSPLKDAPEPQQAESPAVEGENADIEDQLPPIQLQEFLNMTNIHFMELTTTKRRHTTAPGSESKRESRGENASKPSNFEDCVVAGFCTLPMLELFQHSCRELKSYISEGRQVIRSIEEETFADNPPLFREYIKAPADIRIIMDNQFRNVKTHARLLSKATWYEWRMKLLEGLKDGLNRHVQEMNSDSDLLFEYEMILDGVTPALVKKQAELENEASSLRQLAEEMENCDQDELREAREKLLGIDDEILQKKRQLAELESELEDQTGTIETAAEMKAECLQQIESSERIKEQCRGWSAKEINGLKSAVHELQQQTGWAVVCATDYWRGGIHGPSITLSYKDQLKLTFHPAAFMVESPIENSTSDDKINCALELLYSPPCRTKSTPRPKPSPIGALVLKTLQRHLLKIPQAKITPRQLLHFIKEAWNLVLNLEEETRRLSLCGRPHPLRLTDTEEYHSVRARCTVLTTASSTANAPVMKKRLDIDFIVENRLTDPDSGSGAPTELGKSVLDTEIRVTKVYGFEIDYTNITESHMKDILSKELKKNAHAEDGGTRFGQGIWCSAVQALLKEVFGAAA